MARPTSKEELLTLAEVRLNTLFTLIDSMSEEEQERTFTFEDRDRTIRDVLIHLHAWHNLLLEWVQKNLQGEPASFLPKPYNWRTYPEMNLRIQEAAQSIPLKLSKTLLRTSHQQTLELAKHFNEDELFIKGYFPWNRTATLASYFISSLPSHYDWAQKKVKRHKRSLR